MNRLPKNDEQWIRTLEAIHDEAVDAIITIEESGIIKSINPATESLFGYRTDELLGKNVKILMPDPYSQDHNDKIRNYLKSGERKVIGIGREAVGLRKNGTTFPIHLAVSEIEVGDQRLFAGVVRDLSEFKRLEEHKETLGSIIESSLNEVFFFDANSLQFIRANHGARENLGYTIDELRSLTPVDIKPEFSESVFREKIAPLLNGNSRRIEFDTIHLRKDGSTYEVEVHLQMAVYRDLPVFVAFVLDVSKRRRAERALQEQRQAMQTNLEQLVETRTAELHEAQAELVRSEKYSTLGKVSGSIAHEIRNPLNAVKTSAYYLLNVENVPPEKIREHLERIDRQVTRIDNVVTALSDVAKLPTANLNPVDLEPILRTAVDSANLPDNIRVVYELPSGLPDVMVDESQIMIAITNLVRNARDAMLDGGTLTISAQVSEDQVLFTLADTGVGIAPEHLEQILEPLFTTKARGMGLGLSITRAIAEKNECTLTFESELGKGSIFGIGLKRKSPK